MKKALLLKSMLLLCALIVGMSSVWGQTEWSYTFNSSSGAVRGNNILNEKSWTLATDPTDAYWANESTGLHVGSSSKGIKTFTLSSSAFDGTITKVVIRASGNGTNPTASVSVGGTAFTVGSTSNTSATMTNSYADYTFNGSKSGEIEIALGYSSKQSKNVFIQTITVTYTTGGSNTTVINATSPVNISAEATSGEIPYSISYPISGTNLTAAKKSGDWISNVSVDATNNKVTFATTANTGAKRTGEITLTYGNLTKDITINQAGKPTVTIETPTGGTLVVKNNGVAISSGSLVASGTELTIEATPDENYRFRNWQYKKGDASWATRTTTFTYTMDDDDVSFRANFDLTYAVNWSVNGTIASMVRYINGETIKLPERPETIGEKSFVGWTTTEIDGNQSTAPTFLSYGTTMGTSDITYYAVFANASGTNSAASLTGNEIKSNITSSNIAYGNEKTYNDTSDGITWVVSGFSEGTTPPWIQLKKANNAYIKISTTDNIDEVKLTISNAQNAAGGANYINQHGAFAGTVYLCTSALATPSGDIASSNDISNNTVELNLPVSTNELYVQVDAGARVWGIEVQKNNYTYSNYCTTVPPTTLPFTISSAATDGTLFYTTFSSAYPFEVPEEINGEYFEVSEISVENGRLEVVSYDEGDVVPANTGVMVASTAAGNYSFNVSSNEGVSYFDELNYLLPTGNGITAEQMAQIGNDYKFYALTKSGGKLGFWYVVEGGAAFDYNVANRAYLAVPTSALGPSSAIGFGFDDETTSIQNIERTINDNQYYTLDGRRVAQPTKGLYILNGRKVIVK